MIRVQGSFVVCEYCDSKGVHTNSVEECAFCFARGYELTLLLSTVHASERELLSKIYMK